MFSRTCLRAENHFIDWGVTAEFNVIPCLNSIMEAIFCVITSCQFSLFSKLKTQIVKMTAKQENKRAIQKCRKVTGSFLMFFFSFWVQDFGIFIVLKTLPFTVWRSKMSSYYHNSWIYFYKPPKPWSFFLSNLTQTLLRRTEPQYPMFQHCLVV